MTNPVYQEEKRLIKLYEACVVKAESFEIDVVFGASGFELTVGGKERAYNVPNLDELDSLLWGVEVGLALAVKANATKLGCGCGTAEIKGDPTEPTTE